MVKTFLFVFIITLFTSCSSQTGKSSFASYRAPSSSSSNVRLASYKAQKMSTKQAVFANYKASPIKAAGCGRFASYKRTHEKSKTHFAAYKNPKSKTVNSFGEYKPSKTKDAVSLATYKSPSQKGSKQATFGTYKPEKSGSSLTIQGNIKSGSRPLKNSSNFGAYELPKTKGGLSSSAFNFRLGASSVRKTSSIANSSSISVSDKKKAKVSFEAPAFGKKISLKGIFKSRNNDDAFLAVNKKTPARSKRKWLSFIFRKDMYKTNYALNDPYKKTKRSKKKKMEKGLFQPGVVKVSDID